MNISDVAKHFANSNIRDFFVYDITPLDFQVSMEVSHMKHFDF